MKLTVANLSSNTLAVPAPLNVTLTGGKSVVVVLKDLEWKAVQTSVPINRLLSAKMLALAVVEGAVVVPVAAPAPAPAPAPEPEPEAAPPAPEPEAPAAEVAPEAAVPAPEPEAAPAKEEPVVEEKKPSKKKGAKEGKGW